jgi:uncharacterized phage infection (PIP) family protein YhgE
MTLPEGIGLARFLRRRGRITKFVWRIPAVAGLCLLSFLLTGCFHKSTKAQNEPLAPPIVDTPPAKPAPAPTDLPPPVVSVPNQTPAPVAAAPEPAPKAPVRHKKQAPPQNPAQQAANQGPGVSAVGQLSSGDPADQRQQTIDSIANADRDLNSLNRKLNDQETKTALQIKEYLKEAHTALASGDLDGAHTLVAKARVLLSELDRSN